MTDRERMEDMLAALRPHLDRMPSVRLEGERKFVLFLSFSDGSRRATVRTFTSRNVEDLESRISAELGMFGEPMRWVRFDWVDAVEQSTWQALRHQLSHIKRNYFRLGIALDPDFEQAFLETEINANAMLYGGPGLPSAMLNAKNFATYAARRHGLHPISFADSEPLWLFTTGGVFFDEHGRAHPLDDGGLNAGRRRIERLTPQAVESLIISGSDYLATQVQEDGRFHYGWHPCFDRPIGSYNSLRHASTLYAMLEAWEVNRSSSLETAIRRAMGYLTETLIQWAPLPSGEPAAFLVDTDNEIKLGGNAVAILALVKHADLTGEQTHLPLMEALASGIVHMQDPKDGRFDHVLNWPGLDRKQAFRIIYYDGEAAFALMRLYGLTHKPEWLTAVENAFAHFIGAGHEKAHDHWLSYCVNELTRYRPDERYFRFALDNVRDHLDFVEERITTFPTLLELMMAASETITRLASDPTLAHLLDNFDIARFEQALEHRAHYLLNGHFWPELAMFYANPRRIAGSFFIRHHAFRVRIDDVEHYLSGFVAYRRLLLARAAATARPDALPGASIHWTASDVTRATGGNWVNAPPPQWQASGLCIAPATMQPGDMVAVRLTTPGVGISPISLHRLRTPPAALIVADAAAVAEFGLPTLVVPDVAAAVLALGHYARTHTHGRLVAVTGSAGKTTTVAMTAHALAAFGKVAQTRHNANLPAGVAWNLASVPRDTPNTVLELAIGRMPRTARMARPDVAVFTNILPAHLEYHKDLATVAARKSAIFEGMRPGGIAVLNRDMEQWERVYMAARARGLHVIHYGTSPESTFRLIGYDGENAEVHASVDGRQLHYSLPARGQHMALNSLAVLAVVSALGNSIDAAVARLESFMPAAGRGNEFGVELPDGRRLTVIDDAYNANPGSMSAAFAALGTRPVSGRRIAVIGEMLELGEHAAGYHDALAPLAEQHGIDMVYAMGPLYEGFWRMLAPARRGAFVTSLDEIRACLEDGLRDGDTVLLKGSHGTGMYRIPEWLASQHVAGHKVWKSHGV